jgi:hypothetical protein
MSTPFVYLKSRNPRLLALRPTDTAPFHPYFCFCHGTIHDIHHHSGEDGSHLFKKLSYVCLSCNEDTLLVEQWFSRGRNIMHDRLRDPAVQKTCKNHENLQSTVVEKGREQSFWNLWQRVASHLTNIHMNITYIMYYTHNEGFYFTAWLKDMYCTACTYWYCSIKRVHFFVGTVHTSFSI